MNKKVEPDIMYKTMEYGEICEHKIKYNSKGDFIFCTKCGIRWVRETETTTTYNPYVAPYTTVCGSK